MPLRRELAGRAGGWDKNHHGQDKTGHGLDKTGPGSGVEGTTKFIMTELVVPINTIRRASQTQSDGPNTIKNAAIDGIRSAQNVNKTICFAIFLKSMQSIPALIVS